MTHLRWGYTTGTCAAAAAKAAVRVLCGRSLGETHSPEPVVVTLPDGERVSMPVARVRAEGRFAEAAVRKDAGDDPDITNGLEVVVRVERRIDGRMVFAAGPGVGTVTRPGLMVPPGEAAINPVPRAMICAAIREVSDGGFTISVSIPGGQELAQRTFNPRLGVVGGLSILGTTGRVRPFSCSALRQSLRCTLDVAAACGVRSPVLVPGHYGERAARALFRLSEVQVIPVGNEWGYVLGEAGGMGFERVLLVGHPGKLAKLAAGHWDTHSARSPAATEVIRQMVPQQFAACFSNAATVEEAVRAMTQSARREVFSRIAERIRDAVEEFIQKRFAAAVILVDMQGEVLASAGDMTSWTRVENES